MGHSRDDVVFAKNATLMLMVLKVNNRLDKQQQASDKTNGKVYSI